jgi:CcmD family protein
VIGIGLTTIAPALRGGALAKIAPALRGGASFKRVLCGFAFALALGLSTVHAQDAQQGAPAAQADAQGADASEQRSQSFQAVRGAVKEDVAGGPLLVIAYAAIWVVLLLYVVRLVRLQQRVLTDVERLERVLSQSSTGSSTTR